MTEKKLKALMTELVKKHDLKEALALLVACDIEEIASTATELQGHFFVAEVDNVHKIYHSSTEIDDEGTEKEYLDHVMNVGDDIMCFVTWFFDSFFEIKTKEIYALAGKTYKQQKKETQIH
jgi:hypothetical protein